MRHRQEEEADMDCGGDAAEQEGMSKQQQAGVQELLCSLSFGSVDVRIRAAREVRRLTKTSAKTRVFMAAAGIIGPLVLMLKSPSCEAQEAALPALLNLAVGNERNKLKIVKAGAIEPLVELLRGGSDSIRESAAAALYTLSAAPPNKAAIGAAGCVPLLVGMVAGGSVQGKVDAVMALYNLSTDPANVAAILAARPVAPLLLLLKSCKKAGRVAEKATSLLEALSAFDEARASIAKLEGGILTLVEVLEDGSSRSREHAVATLAALLASNRAKFREAILREGAIPGLLELTVQGTPRAQHTANMLLEQLRDPPCRRADDGGGGAAIIESLVSDIADHVDADSDGHADGGGGPRGGQLGAARKMLTEMVQLSMEQSMRHLQQRALLSRAPSSARSACSSSSSCEEP